MSKLSESGGGAARGDGEPEELRALADWTRKLASAVQNCHAAVTRSAALADRGWISNRGLETRAALNDALPGLTQMQDDARKVAAALDEHAEQLERAQAKIDPAREYVWFGDGQELDYTDGKVHRPQHPPGNVPTSVPVYDQEDYARKSQRYAEEMQEAWGDYNRKLAKFDWVLDQANQAVAELDPTTLLDLIDAVLGNKYLTAASFVTEETGAVATAYQKIFMDDATGLWKIAGRANQLSWLSWRLADAPDIAKWFDEIDREHDIKAIAEHAKAGHASTVAKVAKGTGYLLLVVGIGAELVEGKPPLRVALTTGAGVIGGKAAAAELTRRIGSIAGAAAGPAGAAAGTVVGLAAGYLVGEAYDSIAEQVQNITEPIRYIPLDDDWSRGPKR